MRTLLDDLAYIEGRIKSVNGKVEAYASQHEAAGRLVTIPGIGNLVRLRLSRLQGTDANSARRGILPRGWVIIPMVKGMRP